MRIIGIFENDPTIRRVFLKGFSPAEEKEISVDLVARLCHPGIEVGVEIYWPAKKFRCPMEDCFNDLLPEAAVSFDCFDNEGTDCVEDTFCTALCMVLCKKTRVKIIRRRNGSLRVLLQIEGFKTQGEVKEAEAKPRESEFAAE